MEKSFVRWFPEVLQDSVKAIKAQAEVAAELACHQGQIDLSGGASLEDVLSNHTPESQSP
eukprot:9453384-Pyramimonas_sp.AAC.1